MHQYDVGELREGRGLIEKVMKPQAEPSNFYIIDILDFVAESTYHIILVYSI